ncbi:TPA: tyrosine-type recombinase/integrase [Klebsiella pneumoniae]|uniref:tyrosine-type recombinase/integrase n=1 Tax=Klebsiella pneumoniae complex TaxID=3390273 RepID=UPI0005797C0F|nr:MULTISPECIES: tyrosine-type recombinase/integrase [Klebsiella]HCD1321836.1 tyrosine-type recombinase/integrase [Klebsiella pneumoniae subsp. pneumoniae]EIV5339296.1 tyrosine-type recombinase/integrase [Klebsiella pneumoniae]EKX8353158.1 tyrosine-type recombinase/integrase [Klebsiella pneumoniae]ELA2936031.1 tyrosine-type recombinase/integrase [Klebsiella pneumoniae]EMF2174236.1 tyrosine-type recombinase/integrase [Klebsiella pneumoniae]
MSIKSQSYLYPTPEGVWMFQIFVPKYMRHIFGGKRLYRKSTGTKDLATAKHFRNHMLIEWKALKEQYCPDTEERRINNAILELRAQTVMKSPLQAIPTLIEIRDRYAEQYKDRRSFSTLAKSARSVEVFLKHLECADIKITKIRRSQVALFAMRHIEKKADQTVQNWLTCLGSLYEFARRVHDDIPPDNPFHGHNLEARASIVSYEPFEPDQMQKLLDAAEPEIRNIIMMGLFSGCRLDELASLKKSEIKTVEGVRTFFISKSKTKAGIRHVPIHSRLSAIVDEYLSHNYGEYLFPQANKINRADGKKGPFYSQAFTRLRRRVLPTATDRQCFHSLRGMFITCLDRAGVSETRIGSITGHTEQKAKTEAFRTYSQGASMKELKGIIELIRYPEIEKGA